MKRVEAISRKTLRMILEASRDMYPREFGAILRAVQDGAVGRLDSVGNPLDAERFEDLLAGPHAHRPAGVRIGEEASDLVREVPRVDRVGEETVPAVLDHLAHSRDVGDDDRLPRR